MDKSQQVFSHRQIAQGTQNSYDKLSYTNRRLSDYIQIQIHDIESTLKVLQKRTPIMQLKQILSHSFSIFCQAQSIFKQLHTEFLYRTIRKLINCYSIIFLIMLQQLDQMSKNGKTKGVPSQYNQSTENNQHELSKQNTQRQQQTTTRQKIPNPMGGVCLYNEKYKRHIQYRDRDSKKQRNAGDVLRKQQKFNIEIQEQLKQIYEPEIEHYQTPVILMKDNDYISQAFQEQIRQIVNNFNDSQSQAISFLNKQQIKSAFLNFNDNWKEAAEHYITQKSKLIYAAQCKIKQFIKLYKAKKQENSRHLTEKVQKQDIKNVSSITKKQYAAQTEDILKRIEDENKLLKNQLKINNKKILQLEQLRKDEVQHHYELISKTKKNIIQKEQQRVNGAYKSKKYTMKIQNIKNQTKQKVSVAVDTNELDIINVHSRNSNSPQFISSKPNIPIFANQQPSQLGQAQNHHRKSPLKIIINQNNVDNVKQNKGKSNQQSFINQQNTKPIKRNIILMNNKVNNNKKVEQQQLKDKPYESKKENNIHKRTNQHKVTIGSKQQGQVIDKQNKKEDCIPETPKYQIQQTINKIQLVNNNAPLLQKIDTMKKSKSSISGNNNYSIDSKQQSMSQQQMSNISKTHIKHHTKHMKLSVCKKQLNLNVYQQQQLNTLQQLSEKKQSNYHNMMETNNGNSQTVHVTKNSQKYLIKRQSNQKLNKQHIVKSMNKTISKQRILNKHHNQLGIIRRSTILNSRNVVRTSFAEVISNKIITSGYKNNDGTYLPQLKKHIKKSKQKAIKSEQNDQICSINPSIDNQSLKLTLLEQQHFGVSFYPKMLQLMDCSSNYKKLKRQLQDFHGLKCGINCSYLLRYMERICQEKYPYYRQPMKIHIENVNQVINQQLL